MDISNVNARGVTRLHLVIALVMCAVVVLIAWTTWSARALVVTFVPQVDASMSARLAVAEAHLWMEEIVSGDGSEDPQQVWSRIDEARATLDAMLLGGQGERSAILAVGDDGLREELAQAQAHLLHFEQIGHSRIGALNGGVGSDMDDQFDEAYQEFVGSTVAIEGHLKAIINRSLAMFLLLQGVLVLSVIGLFCWVIWLLRWKEALDRDAHVRKLQESLDALARSRQELERQHTIRGALVDFVDAMQGLEKAEDIAVTGLRALCDRTGANVGACWLYRMGDGLRQLAGYSLPEDRRGMVALEEGEGLVGQVARNRKAMVLDMPAGYLKVASGLGQTSAAHVRILPLMHDGAAVGVLELAFLSAPDDDAIALVESVLPALAIRLHLAQRGSGRMTA